MSYDTKQDTITVNDVTYHVEREQDRGGSGEETLTIKDFSVEQDDWIFPFEGLEGTLGYEQYIDEGLSPRQWSNVGKMACYHSGYNLGDDIDPRDFLDNEVECDLCEGTGEIDPSHAATADVGAEIANNEGVCNKCEGTGYIETGLVEYVRKEYGARVIIPLFLYDHSGISMSAGQAIIDRSEDDSDFDRSNRHPFDAHGWDVSSVGVIFDTPEGVEQCIGKEATVDEIKAALLSEVEVYSSYLEGDITYYNVEDDETNFHDSCGGFVGDHKQCEAECFAALEGAIIKRLGENNERAEWNARGTETK